MLERIDGITNEVLEPIIFVLAYATVLYLFYKFNRRYIVVILSAVYLTL
jgi:hypothetical protein